MNKNSEKIVIGHKNPDTDTVVSAYIWSSILRKKGYDSKPAVAGDVNKETKLVFEKAGVDIPEKHSLEETDVFLVDHNEKKQRAEGIERVVGIIDHHKLDVGTDSPVFLRNEPLGSTASIIRKITKEQSVELTDTEKFLLLCAIISDTLKCQSPTTTAEDEKYAQNLAEELDIDIDKLAQEMFEAKSDLSHMTIKEIIEADYKNFDMGDYKVGVGVAEVASTNFFKGKKEEILKKMEEVKEDESLDYLFFGVIDILNKNTLLYLLSKKEVELAKKTFGVEGNENPELLKGVASRKKQIVPPLSKTLKK